MSAQSTREAAASGLMCDDPVAVSAWLRSHGEHVGGDVTIARMGFGQSNITTIITASDGGEWVLREPPPGSHAQSAHDVAREARIVSNLADSGIPVPRVIGTGTTPGGAGFFVMDRVPGAPLESDRDAVELTPEHRHELGLEVIRTLARLHTLDPGAVGLSDLGSKTPLSYLERQIRRLSATWDRVGLASNHDVIWHQGRSRLTAGLPATPPPVVLMHGDFRLSNLLVKGPRITAVLDWELCTLGDPLADLAWLLDDWRQPEDEAISMPSPTRAGGFPDRATMVEEYCRETGFSVDRISYYRGFSQWRAATLLQGVLARRRSGVLGTHGQLDLNLLDHSIATLLAAAASDLQVAT
ncbi:MAG: fadE36 1 [Mycobacterium sp.]|nr:fadE36 1 [Mycobacterium sp.]